MKNFLNTPKHIHSALRRTMSGLLVSVLAGATLAATPPPPALAEFPLAWSDQVIPNFLITLDDSRSMAWGYLPEKIFGDVGPEYDVNGNIVVDGSNNPVYYYPRSSHSKDYNKLAFDPGTVYVPPRRPDGSRFPNANFNLAQIDGFEPFMTAGKRTNGHHNAQVNLSTSYQMTWDYPLLTNGTATLTPFANLPRSAFYTTWRNVGSCRSSPGVPNIAQAPYLGPPSAYATPAAYAAAKAAHGSAWIAWRNRDQNCFNVVSVNAAREQNFANWYSYSRTRILGAINGLVTAMSSTSSDLRAACQALENTTATACNTTVGVMRTMDAAGRTALVQNLINTPIPGDTKLREAAYRAIEYFKRTDNAGPWAFNPATGVKLPEYSCRQSYHMVVTDGAWTLPKTGDPDALLPLADQDRALPNTPLGRPYRDVVNPANEVTLADMTYQAWNTDLRPDLADNVPMRIAVAAPPNPTAAQLATRNADPDNDPAAHQHLSTFTVGFGVNGALSYPSDLTALKNGTKQWTNVFKDRIDPITSVVTRVTNNPGRIDDLWHAAINGRGKYFSAGNPTALAASIQNVIDLVTKGTASGASASSSSNVGADTTGVYIGSYTGGSWSGDLKKYKVLNGVVQPNVQWSAATQLDANNPAPNSRKIFTREGATKYSLAFANMSASMKTLFDSPIGSNVSDNKGSDRVQFLRGVRSEEIGAGAGTFRKRSSALGDIVNSSATFVAGPNAGYDNSIKFGADIPFQGYGAFADTYKTRTQMLYFGANDGMLHGVKADDGVEQFAFIPGAVLAKTRWLPELTYAHATFVDATPFTADIKADAWRTLLFAPFGTGAKGMFAIDVTDPTNVTESNSVWELTSAATPELGYIMGTPLRHPVTGVPRNVGRYGAAGNWAVFLPNGYNSDFPDENGIRSATGSASLIVADLGTSPGANVAAWTPGSNLHVIPTTAAGDGPHNGLSMPTGVDINGDGRIDVLYAGDLKGNLWKFEMTNPATNWSPRPIGSVQVKLLFKAVNQTGDAQAITVAPSVLRMADGKYIVIFGTGRLLTTQDKTRPVAGFPKQSLYGIIDDGGATTTRAQLFVQQIVQTTAATGTGPTAVAGSRFTDAVANQTGTYRGWRMDLDSTLAQDEGERVISNPVLLPGGAVVFSTAAPSIDACSQVGTGWTMILSGLTGGRPFGATFDLNRDGNAENDSKVISGKKMFATGMQSEVGVSPTPLVLATGSTIQLVTGGASRGWSSAQIALNNPKVDVNGRPLWGRIAWQEIGR